MPAPCTLQIHVEDRYIIVYSTKAWQIKDMIESYCIEAEKVGDQFFVHSTKINVYCLLYISVCMCVECVAGPCCKALHV